MHNLDFEKLTDQTLPMEYRPPPTPNMDTNPITKSGSGGGDGDGDGQMALDLQEEARAVAVEDANGFFGSLPFLNILDGNVDVMCDL